MRKNYWENYTKNLIKKGINGVRLLIIIAANLILTILVTVAFMTLLERKIIGGTQNRKGPNLVGLFGLLQPVSDALKLIFKETIFPRNSKFLIFLLSPAISLIFALLAWAVIPLDYNVVLSNINLGVLFIFAISILHIYGIILAGWSSGSRYSFLGAMRSSAQLLGYDIAMGITIACVVVFSKSLNLTEIVTVQAKTGWFGFYLFFLFIIFFICALAETNRHPFDLPEAESELVGGYFTEYSSAIFALFYLGEYCSIMLMCALMVHLFWGGWLPLVDWNLMGLNHPFFWFSFKLLVIYYIFVIVRAALPRYRYDQLMRIGWKYVLPLSFSFFIYLIVVEVGVQALFSAPNLQNSSVFYAYDYCFRAEYRVYIDSLNSSPKLFICLPPVESDLPLAKYNRLKDPFVFLVELFPASGRLILISDVPAKNRSFGNLYKK